MLPWCPERKQKYIVFPEEASYPNPLKGNGRMAVGYKIVSSRFQGKNPQDTVLF